MDGETDFSFDSNNFFLSVEQVIITVIFSMDLRIRVRN